MPRPPGGLPSAAPIPRFRPRPLAFKTAEKRRRLRLTSTRRHDLELLFFLAVTGVNKSGPCPLRRLPLSASCASRAELTRRDRWRRVGERLEVGLRQGRLPIHQIQHSAARRLKNPTRAPVMTPSSQPL